MNAFAVVSDSGTLPEESSYFTSVGHPFPAVCIRTSTERPEALDKADFIIAGIDEKNLLQAVETAIALNKDGNHDSVGGQPTVGLKIDLPAVAKAVGYNMALSVDNMEELKKVLKTVKITDGPIFLEIKVRKGSRMDLGRPTTTPIQNKEALMAFLSK